jgi:hypothetical protein
MRNVAVGLAKQAELFGQRASSQTVNTRCLFREALTRFCTVSGPRTRREDLRISSLIQSGSAISNPGA